MPVVTATKLDVHGKLVAVKVAVRHAATAGKQAIAGNVGISKDPSSNWNARDTSRRSHNLNRKNGRICVEQLYKSDRGIW